MSNILGENLTGRVVIFRQEFLNVPAAEHPFRVEAGFGALSFTTGTALIGEFIADGERTRMDGYMLERFATPGEVAAAEARRDVA